MTTYQRKIKRTEESKPNQDQKRFLVAELQSLASWGSHLNRELPEFKAPTPPREVRQYNRLVARLRADHKRKNDKRKKDFADAVNQVRKAIHFGTVDQALAAIENLTKRFS